MTHLRNALMTRGYPAHMLPTIEYDAENRERLLNRLESKRMMRDQSRSRNREYSVMAFKVPYNQSLHKLRLKKEVDKVVSLLRREVGSDFLENTRLVIAFCVRGASFRLTYGRNILLLVVGGRALVGKVHTRTLKAFDPSAPPTRRI